MAEPITHNETTCEYVSANAAHQCVYVCLTHALSGRDDAEGQYRCNQAHTDGSQAPGATMAAVNTSTALRLSWLVHTGSKAAHQPTNTNIQHTVIRTYSLAAAMTPLPRCQQLYVQHLLLCLHMQQTVAVWGQTCHCLSPCCATMHHYTAIQPCNGPQPFFLQVTPVFCTRYRALVYTGHDVPCVHLVHCLTAPQSCASPIK